MSGLLASPPPSIPQSDIEAGARAICRALGVDPDAVVSVTPPVSLPWVHGAYLIPTDGKPAWAMYWSQAFAVLQDAKRRTVTNV